jgi:hypothetical protein
MLRAGTACLVMRVWILRQIKPAKAIMIIFRIFYLRS